MTVIYSYFKKVKYKPCNNITTLPRTNTPPSTYTPPKNDTFNTPTNNNDNLATNNGTLNTPASNNESFLTDELEEALSVLEQGVSNVAYTGNGIYLDGKTILDAVDMGGIGEGWWIYSN